MTVMMEHTLTLAFIILYHVLVFGYIRGRVSPLIYGIFVVSAWIVFLGGFSILAGDLILSTSYPYLTF